MNLKSRSAKPWHGDLYTKNHEGLSAKGSLPRLAYPYRPCWKILPGLMGREEQNALWKYCSTAVGKWHLGKVQTEAKRGLELDHKLRSQISGA